MKRYYLCRLNFSNLKILFSTDKINFCLICYEIVLFICFFIKLHL